MEKVYAVEVVSDFDGNVETSFELFSSMDKAYAYLRQQYNEIKADLEDDFTLEVDELGEDYFYMRDELGYYWANGSIKEKEVI